MANDAMQLKQIKVPLKDLLLDPNNPRFARSLNLPATVADEGIAAVQQHVRKLFVNELEADTKLDDEDADGEDGPVRIGDLIQSMREIGFVSIDRIVVRKLNGNPPTYVVIEGNRRVSAAKYLHDFKPPQANPEASRQHEEVVKSVTELDVLLLVTEGLTDEELHDQIGVILGLRHFGSVLNWGTLARAVNIYNEYKITTPVQSEFKLEASRITQVATRLSEVRSNVTNALKTYVAYLQLQEAFPQGPPKPAHYSLLQACVVNRRLAASRFIDQDGNTFKLAADSLEKLNIACQFGIRDSLTEELRILRDPKSVSRFSGLLADSANHKDAAVRAFARSLVDEVLNRDRTLDDAVDNLNSFKSDRVWTESLGALLAKVVEPGGSAEESSGNGESKKLLAKDFQANGNDLLHLEEARKAFKKVRSVLDI